jgi:phosphomannomutase
MKNPEELYQEYLTNPLTDAEKKVIVDQKDTYIKNNSFEKELTFGTGGVREIVDHGTNRLNRFNIARLNLSLMKSLTDAGITTPLIIIAYDSRNSSVPFANQSYNILKSLGAKVKIFKQPSPTPLLSFAVRHFNADAGIVLTASHNPPEYNGYKAYGNDGGQIVSPLDKNIEKNYSFYGYNSLNEKLYNTNTPDAFDIIEAEIVEAYLNNIQKESFVSSRVKNISILYSPLHGTGGWIFPLIFHRLNFPNFRVLEKEKSPDGNFPGIKSPNPEDPSAFDGLKSESNNAQILLATDPDADRIGIAILKNGQYTLLTGNQIAILLMNFLINKSNKKANSYICKTIVTTDLLNHIAKSKGIGTVEVLTGFKNIAAALKDNPDGYIFGGEESFGYLPVSWIRDKDSISSAIALCEMAEDEDLTETLDKIYLEYGYYHDHVFSLKIQGGEIEKQSILKKLEDPGKFISKLKTDRRFYDILDLRNKNLTPADSKLAELKKTLGQADVVKFYFEPEMTITIRPSGTEPKIKIYIAMKFHKNLSSENLQEAQKELASEGKILQAELTKLLIS